MVDRVHNAMIRFRSQYADLAHPVLVVAGGVAANSALRKCLENLCDDEGFGYSIPPVSLCTDNAAVIAWAGAERFVCGMVDALDCQARARWPLDATAAPAPFAGVKA